MRINKLLCLCAISLVTLSCGRRGYTIVGDIIDLDQGEISLLDVYGHTLSVTRVEDGKFTFKGKVDVPCLAYINNALGVVYPLDIPVLLENTVIKVTGDARIGHIEITGTKANENMVNFKIAKDRLAPDDTEGYLKLVKDTFEENSDNVLGAMLISNFYSLVSDRELVEYCGRLPVEFQVEHIVAHYRDLAQTRIDTEPGNPFRDFEMLAPDSTAVKLSEVVASSKATVVLFWSSWARDAAKIVPAIVEGCLPYRDAGLEMFNVSLDSDMGKMEECAKDFGLFGRFFANGPDKGDKAAGLYGFEGLPRVVLIGPDGKIAAKGRSFADIEGPVVNIFKSKP